MTREYFHKFLPKYGVELSDEEQRVSLTLNVPPAITHSKGDIKVLYTMLEGDAVPDSWVPFLKLADYIIVPSTFVQNTFKRAGFESTVLPLGYDPDLFNISEATPLHYPYTFLHYEAFQDRKGWKDLLYAWLLSGLAELESECQLVLKTIKTVKEVNEKLENEFLPSNVKIICGELPHKAIPLLLEESDCFVFPSRGEGFSLPPIEAMAMGKPVILTKAHSHMDYYDGSYMYGVNCDIKIPAKYSNWEDQGNFSRCKVEDLARSLKYVYENKSEAKGKGSAAVEYVGRYSYYKTMESVSKFLCHV